MKFENTEIFNFDGAFRGMRNPLNSWERSDSYFGTLPRFYPETCSELKEVAKKWCDSDDAAIINEKFEELYEKYAIEDFNNPLITHFYFVGPNDLDLAQRLIKGGTEHSKFMRQIIVNVDITADRGLWSEFDTYRFNTKNSCSTMHKLFDKKNPITLDMFSYNQEDEEFMKMVVEKLNCLRDEYFSSEAGASKNELLARAKKLLPEGYLQKRTVTTNYAELRNIYFQRRNHRLKEWKIDFVNWVNTLPLAEELIKYEG